MATNTLCERARKALPATGGNHTTRWCLSFSFCSYF